MTMYSRVVARMAAQEGITFDLGEGPTPAVVEGMEATAVLGPWDHPVTSSGMTITIGGDSELHPFESLLVLPAGAKYLYTLTF